MGILSVSHLYNLYRITVETNLPKENFWHKKMVENFYQCVIGIWSKFTSFLLLLFFFKNFRAITLWEDVAAANTWSILYHVD